MTEAAIDVSVLLSRLLSRRKQNMSRFEDISDEDLNNLLENRDSLSTKNVVKSAVTVFKTYCTERNVDFPSEDIDKSSLDCLLSKFYAAARKVDGELYTKKSLLSIRYGLQKHFEKALHVDIVNDIEFRASNRVFQAMLVKLKQQGKACVQHKEPLSKQDLQRLYRSFDVDTPAGLQDKVFVDFMHYFCNRGRENLRDIKKSDFIFNENDYIELRDMKTKNHTGELKDGTSQGGRIYKTGTDLCPYISFQKYISVLNKGTDVFFQKPKSVPESDTWYDVTPLGKNTLGDKMKRLSTKAKLSRIYTNHCLRATSITLLDGYEARHVMAISGHKSESSIRSYARTSSDQKAKMALTLAEAVAGPSSHPATVVNSPKMTESRAYLDDIDVNASEFLPLTASQEQCLNQAISTVQDIEPATSPSVPSRLRKPSPQQSLGVFNRTDTHSELSYRAPVYCFNNCSVTINHK